MSVILLPFQFLLRLIIFFYSYAFDAEHVVAHFHESEQVNFGGNNCFLSFSEVELRVGESLKSFTALLFSNDAWTLKVVKGEDVLKLLVGIDNRTAAVIFSNFYLIN